MRFTAEQLRTFVLVVEFGTFEAAADLLMVSASAISQRIKAMEQTAGRVLIKRTNPVVPTETGEIVLRIARQSEYLSSELERELGGSGGERTIAIAVNADSLSTWLLSAVGKLAREDRIFCDLRREGEQYSSALLRSGEAMAAITSDPETIPGCTVEKLGNVRYWIAASAEFVHRHFKQWPKQITVEELNAAPTIEYDHKDVGQKSSRALILKNFGLDETVEGESPSVYVPSSPDYARAIYEGIGWGILPTAQCEQQLKSGELVLLASEPLDAPLYWQRWKISSEVLDVVTSRVYEAAKTLS
ncbi:ArgP/LysG family DNA-binding transcriptional regulator [Rothia amarae]|uniref:ArgP/LysG family DNA-binding transcriptional regulator n=1 Tax=Rothia amarae TaxID=169480 RepID=A0A7H2BJM1_9MICC|nr:ArgP/LysG family DNA-binding transcriptional regulator [Rothia amarae]QNV39867.1 ArgP/LysG family DNA-binding transcriptional regulator [Rothia amarae]